MRKKGKEGEETTELKEIQRIFEVFYSKLYLKREVDKKKIEQYLERHIGKLDFEEPKEDIKQILNAVISKEEVEKAITELKLNTAPGPDGFSAKKN